MNSTQTEQKQEQLHLPHGVELDLQQRGIEYTVERVTSDNGSFKRGDLVAKITSIPAIEHAAIGILSGVDEPPNEEVKKLYEEYKSRVEEGQCKGCARGRLIKEYSHKLRVALQGTKLLEYYEKEEERRIKYERVLQEQEELRLKNEQLRREQEEATSHRAHVEESRTSEAEANDSTAPVPISGSGAESTSGDGKRPSMLRRAIQRIKKIYRACTEP